MNPLLESLLSNSTVRRLTKPFKKQTAMQRSTSLNFPHINQPSTILGSAGFLATAALSTQIDSKEKAIVAVISAILNLWLIYKPEKKD